MNAAIDNAAEPQNVCTHHAATRMHQRAVPPVIVQWLRQFGTEMHDKHGAVVCYFDKAARRRMERVLGRVAVRQMARFLDAYLVEADGAIVTVGRRTQRVWRH